MPKMITISMQEWKERLEQAYEEGRSDTSKELNTEFFAGESVGYDDGYRDGYEAGREDFTY